MKEYLAVFPHLTKSSCPAQLVKSGRIGVEVGKVRGEGVRMKVLLSCAEPTSANEQDPPQPYVSVVFL